MYTPTTYTVHVLVDSVDISAYVPRASGGERRLPGIGIRQVIGQAIDTCRFGIENGAALTIEAMAEVYIKNEAETVTYFGGVVAHVTRIPVATELDLIVDCQDFTALLDKAIINQEWGSSTADTTILANIASNATPALSDFDFSTYVDAVDSAERLRFSRVSVRAALDELAKRVGANWYVDYDKKLHWFSAEENSAAFELCDRADTSAGKYPYSGIDKQTAATDITNRVTIVGGDFFSANVTHEYAGDNQQVRFVVPYFYHAQAGEVSVLVDKNTGTDLSPSWTAQTVGVKYIDDSAGKNVLFAFREKFFEFATAPANLARGWRLRARYEAPLRSRVQSDDSYVLYGRWLDSVIVDESIKNKAEGQQRGKAEMAEKALARTAITLATSEPGLHVGEVVKVTNSVLSITGLNYIIQEMATSFLGGDTATFQLSLGDYIPDLYSMMLDIARRSSGTTEWREDETLDQLLMQFESVLLTEAITAVAPTTTYKWGVDADDFNWGFGKWA